MENPKKIKLELTGGLVVPGWRSASPASVAAGLVVAVDDAVAGAVDVAVAGGCAWGGRSDPQGY